MALDITNEKGVPLGDQELDWRAMVDLPFSKLDDDAFTRVRVILMNGIESEAIRFSHACARMNRDLQIPLARVRRIEQHQQTLVNWLNPPDQDPLETTIGFEQTAIEITAAVALREPDEYLKQVYRFGMLEDFDHLYRYAALMDRLQGKDANNILQSYTDIRPGRPTVYEHRDPEDDLRECYQRSTASAITKLNALTIVSAEHQVHDYYMNIGPLFSDPIARALYAEIASIEEQHVTQYESIIDTEETWLEKWLLHEATEVFNYYSCLQHESNPRIKKIWERFVDYELGQLHFVRDLFQRYEGRDPAEVLPNEFPDPMEHEGHREFIRETISKERELRADGVQFIPESQLPAEHRSRKYAERVHRAGVPSEIVAAGYLWMPGTIVERDFAAGEERRTVQ